MGLPIVATDKPVDEAIRRACQVVLDLSSTVPTARQRMKTDHIYFIMMAKSEKTVQTPEYRSRVASIGQDIASLARKQIGKPVVSSPERALQARKDLTAMGLKYHDPNDFLEAVRRDDRLAVELFVEGRGVNLGARDAQGKTALEIARAKGNEPMAQLLSRSLPATR